MENPRPLEAADLRWHCRAEELAFETTDDLEDLEGSLGQHRALESLRFGTGIEREGYNIFALGPPGMGKRTLIERYLESEAAPEETPGDCCYVHNFADANKPQALRLPAGRGTVLRNDMNDLVDDLRAAIPAALESEEHRSRIQEIEQEYKERHERALEELTQKAEAKGIQLIRTPGGFALAPIHEGEVLSPEQFEKLPEEEQRKISESVAELQKDLQAIIEQVPQMRKEAHDRVKELNREASRLAIDHSMKQLKERYRDLPEVVEYLEAVEQDVIQHAEDFNPSDEETPNIFGIPVSEGPSYKRYQVNLLVDRSEAQGAPVVFEDHPTFQNLLGRVEHQSRMGTLVTDFTLIKPGALHRANGGYLMIDTLKMLQQPYAWEGLKRALGEGQIRIESLGEALSLVSTVSLEPEPVPLDVKVVLLGGRMLYYLLRQYDQDFAKLFKVAADFEEIVDRSPESCEAYARLLAGLIRREKLRPFDTGAVARTIEETARLAGDAEKLSTHMRSVADLVREADYWAGDAGSGTVKREHVEKAIDQQIYRSDRIRSRIQEEIQRGTILIDTDGERVGQVNGLSVIDLGDFAFGRPSRITAAARLGKGSVVDIEREVELGGAIHSKGVLIISGFVGSRYATRRPLSLDASLVFEQSYGPVEGDSASVAELCALLSVLSDVPIRQSLAVTGSVNQLGHVQAIGGVNEKIEGFFDVCNARGLSGEQGVLIPASNVKHLMLRRDVIEACSAGRFHVHPVETVEQAIGLLTGVAAGERDEQGNYPDGSVNQRVEARLLEFSEIRQRFIESRAPEVPRE